MVPRCFQGAASMAGHAVAGKPPVRWARGRAATGCPRSGARALTSSGSRLAEGRWLHPPARARHADALGFRH